MRGARERFEPLMLDHVGYDFNIINEVCVKVREIFNPEASRGAGVQTCSQYDLSVMPYLVSLIKGGAEREI